MTYLPFKMYLTIRSETELSFSIKQGEFVRTEAVAIEIVPLGKGLFAVSWKESNAATVIKIQDYDRGVFID